MGEDAGTAEAGSNHRSADLIDRLRNLADEVGEFSEESIMSVIPTDKKYFTLAEANKSLPLVKAIVADISTLAHSMRDRHEKLQDKTGSVREEIEDSLERDQDRMQELVDELSGLGVELKDFFTGLLDFPCWANGREIYLCWKLGEPTIGHWHEVWAGFAGRRKI